MSEKPATPTPTPTLKPAWPFPHRATLFAHNNGSWAKKIKGRMVYFGPWRDPKAALDKFIREQAALYEGVRPVEASPLTVREMVNGFLTMKHDRWQGGEISASMFGDYKAAGILIAQTLGKTTLVDDLKPMDFARLRASIRGGVVTRNSIIGWMRGFFKWAGRNELVTHAPRYGDEFNKPTKRVIRLYKAERRAEGGLKMFDAAEVHTLIAEAPPSLRVMVHLGINCGFGNKDCAALRRSHIDLESATLTMPRPKTGVERSCPLWPETIEALKAYKRGRCRRDNVRGKSFFPH